jgi:hypothetical protein
VVKIAPHSATTDDDEIDEDVSCFVAHKSAHTKKLNVYLSSCKSGCVFLHQDVNNTPLTI